MNLASILDNHDAERVALIAGPTTLTYGKLRDDVAKVRSVLIDAGIEPGDRVVILCATNLRFVRAWFGILSAGAIAVPLNPQSPALELEAEIVAVGAKAVIAGPAGLKPLRTLDRSAAPCLELIFVNTGADFDDSIDLDAGGEIAPPTEPVERADDDVAALLFTSGTVGRSRPAMLTHDNFLSNLRQVQANPSRGSSPDDVLLCVLPLAHVFGLNSVLNLGLYTGATVVLVERFDPSSFIKTIIDNQVTVLFGAPTMWSALVAVEGATAEDFASVRLSVSGAAPLSTQVAEEAKRKFGLELAEGYGLTEASPAVTSSAGFGAPFGSIGRPIHGVEVRLVDENGDDVYIGDPGEIWVRGPNVFAGYWNDPEATALAIDPEGWLHTGDIAVVDEDGFLFIVDRAKDLIIVSGFNVYPAEVESVLIEHPSVKDAAVIGVPHPHSGEAVKAFVVRCDGCVVEEDELIDWCAARLARYKCPTKVDLVASIPRGEAGKLLRRELV